MTSHSFTELVLLLSFLIRHAIALPEPLPRAKLVSELESRELCYDDDVLWSFQYWLQDSVPYCSSLLGIQDKTVTVNPITSYTTTNTIVTTEYDNPTDTITIPQTTVFSTRTAFVSPVIKNQFKRQINCNGDDCAQSATSDGPSKNFTDVAIPIPTATPIAVIAPGPVSIPLNDTQSMNQTPPVRTLIAPPPFLSLSSTNPGPTPITENPVPSILADGVVNASIASAVYSACSCLRLKPMTIDVTPTVHATRTISGIDYEAQPSITAGTSTIIVTTEVLLPSFESSVLSSGVSTPSSRSNSSIVPPYPTGRGSVSIPTGLPCGTAPRTPSISLITRSALNESTILRSSATFSISFIASPPMTAPTPSISSISGSNRTGFGSNNPNSTASVFNLSSTVQSGATIAASSSFTTSPSSTPLFIGEDINPAGCPTINNTIYTDNSNTPKQQYQIQCFRQYTGPSFIGLAEPHFESCIEECDKVNLGFSDLECYGVTWLEYSGGSQSVRCLLKTQLGLEQYLENDLAVSAVLLDVPPPIVGLFYPPPREINGTWYPA